MSVHCPASIFRLLLSASLLVCATAHGATQNLNQVLDLARSLLSEQVQQAYGEDASVELLPLDRRLNLARCSQQPEAFLPAAARLHGATTVGVKCLGQRPWTIYVRARVRVWQSVVVTAVALPRGQLLTAADLTVKRVDISHLAGGYLRQIEQATDMELKRAVGPAVVLTSNMVGAPVVISRGEQVTLVSDSSNLRVAMTGKALADGAVGQRIRVENSFSKRRLEGVVKAPGVVLMARR